MEKEHNARIIHELEFEHQILVKRSEILETLKSEMHRAVNVESWAKDFDKVMELILETAISD
jgi:hypothetical protein